MLVVEALSTTDSVSWREHLQGWTGINAGYCKTKQLGQDKAGEVRKDMISGRDHNERIKSTSALQQERGLPSGLAIHYGKWRAQDLKKKEKVGKLE